MYVVTHDDLLRRLNSTIAPATSGYMLAGHRWTDTQRLRRRRPRCRQMTTLTLQLVEMRL
jgi:hypothetical protein